MCSYAFLAHTELRNAVLCRFSCKATLVDSWHRHLRARNFALCACRWGIRNRAQVKWTHTDPNLKMKVSNTDWSAYKEVKFSFYSPKKLDKYPVCARVRPLSLAACGRVSKWFLCDAWCTGCRGKCAVSSCGMYIRSRADPPHVVFARRDRSWHLPLNTSHTLSAALPWKAERPHASTTTQSAHTQLSLIVESRPDSGAFAYYRAALALDFEGWKDFALPFDKFGPGNSPVGWNKVDSAYFSAKGWGAEPNPDVWVVIDDLRLE